jgi:hypothetical protein
MEIKFFFFTEMLGNTLQEKKREKERNELEKMKNYGGV